MRMFTGFGVWGRWLAEGQNIPQNPIGQSDPLPWRNLILLYFTCHECDNVLWLLQIYLVDGPVKIDLYNKRKHWAWALPMCPSLSSDSPQSHPLPSVHCPPAATNTGHCKGRNNSIVILVQSHPFCIHQSSKSPTAIYLYSGLFYLFYFSAQFYFAQFYFPAQISTVSALLHNTAVTVLYIRYTVLQTAVSGTA